MTEIIHTETIDGFKCTLTLEPEFLNPGDIYDPNHFNIPDICQGIDNSDYLWVIGEVKVYKHNILLGRNNLGALHYENSPKGIKELIDNNFRDIANEAIHEAKEVLKLLKQDN